MPRFSTPQQSWAVDMLNAVHFDGYETMADLGCGAGAVTEDLLARVPHGRVVAVDSSLNMLEAARRRLGSRVDFVHADLGSWVPPRPGFGLIISSATLHWVPNHPCLWTRLATGLRSAGRLRIQMGGAGNLPGVEAAMATLAARDPYRRFLHPFQSPWTFDSVETADRDLRDAGFEHVRVWSERRWARPPRMLDFVTNAVARSEVGKLPPPLAGPYLNDFMDLLGRPDRLLYVRLNAEASVSP